MKQKVFLAIASMMLLAVSFVSCSKSEHENKKEVKDWRLISIQYSNSSGNSHQDALSYDAAGKIVKWEQYQNGNCYTNNYSYADNKITIDIGTFQYECTLNNGRISRQERMTREPDIKDYEYDAKGYLSRNYPLSVECEWNNELLTKMAWGAISEYTYTNIPNNIPFIITHSDAILEWQGYYGKRTKYLPSKETRYTYYSSAGGSPTSEKPLVCYEYVDYEYTVSEGLVKEVKCTTHTTNDLGGLTQIGVYTDNWKFEYEPIR